MKTKAFSLAQVSWLARLRRAPRQWIGQCSAVVQGGALGLILLALPAGAQAAFFYTANGDRTISITGYSGAGGAVTIPATIDGLTVTAIGSRSFFDNTLLTNITIPNSVTTIREEAFFGCTSLASVTIPDSVTNIEYRAFFGCSSLANVTIPNGVTTIGGDAFAICRSLASVTIPNSVTSLGSVAFAGCTRLASVTIPSSVTNIGGYAFSGCTNLIGIVVDLDNSAFASEDGVLFDKRRTILIQYPGGKAGNYAIPDSVTTIGNSAFAYCHNLASVTIPNSVTTIPDYAFNTCWSLTNVTIPNSVATIGFGAFAGCSSLVSVPIPNSVTSLGGIAFADCTRLASVTIPNSVATIGFGAFAGCSSLASVTIPNSVTTIEQSAFAYCSNLASVTIPNSVTTIQERAFFGCTSLASVMIPSSVTVIPHEGFAGCTRLLSVTIPDSVTNIESYAFSGCASLASVTIPNSVITIKVRAFSGCTSLTRIMVDVDNSRYASEDGVLFDKSRTSLIQYPGGRVGNYAVPNTVNTIGDSAFSDCTRLTSVTIPNSVITIETYAFYGCTRLAGAYFEGNAPPDTGLLFGPSWSPFLTIFHRANAAGWSETYSYVPTGVWLARPAYGDWAVAAGLTTQYPNARTASDDPDGDGLTNGDEWFAGTEPTQRASRFEIEFTARPEDLTAEDRTPIQAGNHAVYFRSVPGHYYAVESAPDLGGPWTLQGTAVARTTQKRIVLSRPASRAFYRVLALP